MTSGMIRMEGALVLDEKDVLGLVAELPFPAIERPGGRGYRHASGQPFLDQSPAQLMPRPFVGDGGQHQHESGHPRRRP
jgi:hypothetical protein